MKGSDVILVLGVLEQAGIAVWIGGGWGVDALVGRQTRDHLDLDLMFDRNLEVPLVEMLLERGYTETLNWRPSRFVMTDGVRALDLHPIIFLPGGDAMQRTHDDQRFDFAATDFTAGTIDNKTVPCINASLQWTLHQGYEPDRKDVHDLSLLEQLLRT